MIIERTEPRLKSCCSRCDAGVTYCKKCSEYTSCACGHVNGCKCPIVVTSVTIKSDYEIYVNESGFFHYSCIQQVRALLESVLKVLPE